MGVRVTVSFDFTEYQKHRILAFFEPLGVFRLFLANVFLFARVRRRIVYRDQKMKGLLHLPNMPTVV